ncbi:MAG: alpha/beta hydrolase [Muribaculaceae bacterium]|nr:alpha/beta hydrolase [Muribaculaceae bacterium]
MNLYKALSLILMHVAWGVGLAQTQWKPDVLGNDFEMLTVKQPADDLGAATSTVIRYRVSQARQMKRGVLYIHGFNDYFFQAEMAREFVDHGYQFYAVDLRRYGRSMTSTEHRFDVRSLRDYFPDIDSALVEMERAGIDDITLMGHSTGGLIAAYYESQVHPAVVKNLILNSPFLDWNLGSKEWLIPVVSLWGKWFPGTTISQGASTAYSESLLSSAHGEWTYNTGWKLTQSPDVTAGWIRAITLAQKSLRDGRANIQIPILLMHSAQSISGGEWTPDHNRADGVLDVADIRKYGLELGPRVTSVRVNGGLHDLMLSAPAVRNAVYDYIFNWLNRVEPRVA